MNRDSFYSLKLTNKVFYCKLFAMTTLEYPVNVRTAFITVSNKRGLDKLAGRLHEAGTAIHAYGGTADKIRDAGIPVLEVDELIGLNYLFGKKAETLPRETLASMLARRIRHPWENVQAQGITPVDLVCVGLKTLPKGELSIKNIDRGGVVLLRAALSGNRIPVPYNDKSLIFEALGADAYISETYTEILREKTEVTLNAYREEVVSRLGDAALIDLRMPRQHNVATYN
jgi:AICAR transformylase/IMP cyclohydrolase PurH